MWTDAHSIVSEVGPDASVSASGGNVAVGGDGLGVVESRETGEQGLSFDEPDACGHRSATA